MKLNTDFPIEPDYLRLDFGPKSVREHFDWDPEQTDRFTDIELAIAAEQMLTEDYTWTLFDYMMDRIIEIIEQEQHAAAEEAGSATFIEPI